MKLPFKEILLFVGSFILSFLILMFITKLNGQKVVSPQASNTTKANTSPTVAPPTPTPTVAISRKDINVKILNGSGTAGKASELKDLLKKEGYDNILTGNADNFDYKTTEIQVKADKKNIGDLVKNDIKDAIPSPKITTLDDSSAADVVIIFGSDFK